MGLAPAGARAVVGGVEIPLHVRPGASGATIGGWHDGRLRVAVTAPPVDGQANAAVQRAVAAALGVAPNAVAVVAGQTGRRKRVRVDGVTVEAVRARFPGPV